MLTTNTQDSPAAYILNAALVRKLEKKTAAPNIMNPTEKERTSPMYPINAGINPIPNMVATGSIIDIVTFCTPLGPIPVRAPKAAGITRAPRAG